MLCKERSAFLLPSMSASPKNALSLREHSILVVDDQPQNLRIVSDLLSTMGYEVTQASNGKEALMKLQDYRPSLILLDVLMPELNGVDTCKLIKEDSVLADIPIIFLSAADDKNLIVQALESGGVDYVTKPFSRAELLTRVRTHLALKSALDSLKTLAEDKDELLGILTHDLKNHLGGMQMSVQLLQERMARPSGDTKFQHLVDSILQNTAQMFAFVKEFLANNTAERTLHFNLVPLDLGEATTQTVQQYQLAAERKGITIECNFSSAARMVDADKTALKQVLENLVSNAIKFSPLSRKIEISVQPTTGDCVEFRIQDQGPGFTDNDQVRLFQRYARLSARPTAGEPSTGLGLSIVKKLVENMHGHLLLESTSGQGATFMVRLPKARQTQPKAEIVSELA